jgi:type IV pilus assembly protein PilQ
MNHRYIFSFFILALLVLSGDCLAQAPEDNFDDSEKPSVAVEKDVFFPNMDVRSAVKAVPASGEIDIVLSPTVAGRVNLNLTNKTWKQAMEVLCQMFNLQYTVENDYLYIQSLKEYNEDTKEAKLVREIIHVKHTKAQDLTAAVTGLLSERGKVTVVEKSNAFIISDLAPKLTEIKKAITILDVEIYQVHIQAQILEISTDAAQELGINWSAGTGGPSQIDIQNAVNDVPSTVTADAVVGVSSPGRVAASTMSLGFRLLDGKLGVAIEHLLTEGKGEVVAKPQITTLDNTEARIFIGEKRPFLKLDKQLNATTEFVDAGVELIVTPHITNDNRVIIDLEPQRSSATTDPITRGPIVTTTEAKTTVVVNDGETVVIGGLTSKVENETEKGVPLLKDIPLLGLLFKHKSKRIEKKDLVIFITPYIVKKGMNVASAVSLRSRNRDQTLQESEPAFEDPIEAGQEEISDEKVENFLDEISR